MRNKCGRIGIAGVDPQIINTFKLAVEARSPLPGNDTIKTVILGLINKYMTLTPEDERLTPARKENLTQAIKKYGKAAAKMQETGVPE